MRTNFEWTWTVKKVEPAKGEELPVNVGDKVYVKVDENGVACFHRRKEGNNCNCPFWDQGQGRYDAGTKEIDGSLPDGTTFKMRLQACQDRTLLISEHQRNPPQGHWEADDTF